ncbi:amino acid/polyamine transporter I [Fusarium solani]|uniref:Amino acid/polyamine transporter I n=1 Tax=Fusarium solani TaxID=169388 RepID=A0A9P9R7X3_FUSSL|nr:amino acid/polyamine transporter I [Fusarium solani]KAH7268944.1 amino acid/polyamine transporter I [Fusarium solani]
MAADKDKESIAHGDISEDKLMTPTGPEHEVLHRVYNINVFDLGGPMMLIYSTIIVCIGQCLLMSSLAEMCSVWPYSGGQQAFTKNLAPARVRRFLSYLVGWLVLVGDLAASSSCAMNNAQMISAIVQLTHPEFQMTRWSTWLMYIANIVLSVLFTFSQRHLPLISTVGGFITLGGGIAWAMSFLTLSPKQSASFVFTRFMNNSGYASSGWVGIMSFYAPAYALYGTDGILHISEEMKDAHKTAPRAMIWSMIFSGITSLTGAIIMGFCCGNWEDYLKTDLPYIPWFVDTLHGVGGGVAFLAVIIVLLNFLIIIGINTAVSRLAWGMARDNALPFSRIFVKINPVVQTPLNTILLAVVTEIAIAFGSDYAFEAIISFGQAAIQIGYLTPVLMLLWRGRHALPVPRSFTLGSFGLAINIASACWSCLIIIMLVFPLYVPVNAENIYNMNWSIALIGAVVLFVSVDWILRGRYYYAVSEE